MLLEHLYSAERLKNTFGAFFYTSEEIYKQQTLHTKKGRIVTDCDHHGHKSRNYFNFNSFEESTACLPVDIGESRGRGGLGSCKLGNKAYVSQGESIFR